MTPVLPGELRAAARVCLAQIDPVAKSALTEATFAAFRCGRLSLDSDARIALDPPGRPQRPVLVEPRALRQRGLGSREGRAAFIHAIAHIEFNAINLAWDAVARFPAMPAAFYADWAAVAADEARHYTLLAARLGELGYAYGDFPAHDGLWQMAEATADDCLARMALVPRVLEARGLDVTPGMIERLRAVGDDATAAILELILREEVAHVADGSRWFDWCCVRVGCEPQVTFRDLLQRCARGALRGPFNHPARLAAGFDAAELAVLEAAVAGGA